MAKRCQCTNQAASKCCRSVMQKAFSSLVSLCVVLVMLQEARATTGQCILVPGTVNCNGLGLRAVPNVTNITTKHYNFLVSQWEMKNNLIQIINQESFSHPSYSSILNLDLSHNRIRYIPSNTFSGFNSLYTLNLKHNAIRQIRSDAFAGTTLTDTVILSYNRIFRLGPGVVSSDKFRQLYLKHNSLEFFDPKVFSNVPKYQLLYLAGNPKPQQDQLQLFCTLLDSGTSRHASLHVYPPLPLQTGNCSASCSTKSTMCPRGNTCNGTLRDYRCVPPAGGPFSCSLKGHAFLNPFPWMLAFTYVDAMDACLEFDAELPLPHFAECVRSFHSHIGEQRAAWMRTPAGSLPRASDGKTHSDWDELAVVCLKRECPLFPVSKGIVSYANGRRLGSVATIRCETGAISASLFSTCVEQDNVGLFWNSSLYCASGCPRINITGGTVTYNDETRFGSVAHFDCGKTMSLAGPAKSAVCVGDPSAADFAKWNATNRCIDLDECLSNKTHSCSADSACFKTAGSYECCPLGQSWQATSCSAIKDYCPEAQQLNGQVTGTSRSRGGTVQVTCNKGFFSASSGSTLACEAFEKSAGKWNGSVTCVGEHKCSDVSLKVFRTSTRGDVTFDAAKAECRKHFAQLPTTDYSPCLASYQAAAQDKRPMWIGDAHPQYTGSTPSLSDGSTPTGFHPFVCMATYQYLCSSSATKFLTPRTPQSFANYTQAEQTCAEMGAHLPDETEHLCVVDFLLENKDTRGAWLRDMPMLGQALAVNGNHMVATVQADDSRSVICETLVPSDYCPYLYVTHGNTSYPTGRWFGAKATIDCEEGYVLSSNSSVVCVNSSESAGNWAHVPQCEKNLTYCPLFGNITNGQIVYSKDRAMESLAMAQCHGGYVAMPGPTLVCQTLAKGVGAWDATATCIRKSNYCPVPIIQNGLFTLAKQRYVFDVGTVSCNQGYVVDTSIVSVCIVHTQASGYWQNLPRCIVIPNYCPELRPGSGVFTSTNRSINGIGNVKCFRRFFAPRGNTLKCLVLNDTVGKWNASGSCIDEYLCAGTLFKMVLPWEHGAKAYDAAAAQCSMLGGQLPTKANRDCALRFLAFFPAWGASWLRGTQVYLSVYTRADLTNNQWLRTSEKADIVCQVKFAYTCGKTSSKLITPRALQSVDTYAMAESLCDAISAHLPDKNEVSCVNNFLKENADTEQVWLRDTSHADKAFVTSTAGLPFTLPTNLRNRIVCEELDPLKIDYCPWLYLDNGRVVYSRGRIRGALAQISCYEGFSLVGPASIQCLKSTNFNGVWSNRPVCPVNQGYCPLHGTVANGLISYSPTMHRAMNSVATLSCEDGYQARHGLKLACVTLRKNVGMWNVTAACDKIPKYCTPFSVIDGTLAPTVATEVDDVLRLQCHLGFARAGDEKVSCLTLNQAIGRWSGTPVCNVISPYCPALTSPNGQFTANGGGRIGERETLLCDAAYKPSTADATYQCGPGTAAAGKWSGSALCTKITGYCSSVAVLHGSLAYTGQRRIGDTLQLTCNEGYIPAHGVVMFHCKRDTANTGVWNATARCIVDTGYCSRHGDVQHGQVHYHNSSARHRGSAANLTCRHGYVARDGSVLWCITQGPGQGQWNATAHCEKISEYCPVLSVAYATLNDSTIQSLDAVVTVTCHHGYVAMNGMAVKCIVRDTASGRWNVTVKCEKRDGYCPKLSVPSGSLVLSGARRINDTAQLVCVEGYVPAGGHTSFTCLQDAVSVGNWNGRPNCVENTTYCREHGPIAHGRVKYTSARTLGSAAQVQCDLGYQPLTTTLTCLVLVPGAGQWDKAAQCERIPSYCALPTIDNGHVIDSTQVLIGDVLVFNCSHGYVSLNGTRALCEPSNATAGEWNVSTACEAIPSYCPPLAVTNGVLNFKQDNFTQSNFTQSNFTQSNFTQNNFTQSNFTQSNFTRNNFSQSNFTQSNFTRSNFTQSNFTRNNFTQSNFTRNNFTQSNFTQSNFTRSNFTQSNFTRNNFTQSNFTQSNFTQSNFTQSNFTRSNFTRSNFTRSNFTRSDFTRNNFTQSNFTQSNFTQSNFTQSNFMQSNFPQSNFPQSIGSNASLACEPGYVGPDGKTEFLCEASNATMGAWSAEPSCKLFLGYCPEVNLTHGVVVYEPGRTLGSVAWLTCFEGYRTVSGSSFLCLTSSQSTGNWNGSIECRPYCTAGHVERGDLKYATGGNSANGSKAILTCHAGYMARDDRTETDCVPLGRFKSHWSGDLACIPIPRYCTPINTVFGTYTYSTSTLRVETVASLSCRPGYLPGNVTQFRCQVNKTREGYWTGSGKCSVNENYCQDLETQHGAIRYSYKTRLGSVATFKCHHGYAQEASVTCEYVTQQAGRWTSAIDCDLKPAYCNSSYRVTNGYFEFTEGTTLHSVTELKCIAGYALSDDNTYNCTAVDAQHGAWQGNGQCKWIEPGELNIGFSIAIPSVIALLAIHGLVLLIHRCLHQPTALLKDHQKEGFSPAVGAPAGDGANPSTAPQSEWEESYAAPAVDGRSPHLGARAIHNHSQHRAVGPEPSVDEMYSDEPVIRRHSNQPAPQQFSQSNRAVGRVESAEEMYTDELLGPIARNRAGSQLSVRSHHSARSMEVAEEMYSDEPLGPIARNRADSRLSVRSFHSGRSIGGPEELYSDEPIAHNFRKRADSRLSIRSHQSGRSVGGPEELYSDEPMAHNFRNRTDSRISINSHRSGRSVGGSEELYSDRPIAHNFRQRADSRLSTHSHHSQRSVGGPEELYSDGPISHNFRQRADSRLSIHSNHSINTVNGAEEFLNTGAPMAQHFRNRSDSRLSTGSRHSIMTVDGGAGSYTNAAMARRIQNQADSRQPAPMAQHFRNRSDSRLSTGSRHSIMTVDGGAGSYTNAAMARRIQNQADSRQPAPMAQHFRNRSDSRLSTGSRHSIMTVDGGAGSYTNAAMARRIRNQADSRQPAPRTYTNWNMCGGGGDEETLNQGGHPRPPSPCMSTHSIRSMTMGHVTESRHSQLPPNQRPPHQSRPPSPSHSHHTFAGSVDCNEGAYSELPLNTYPNRRPSGSPAANRSRQPVEWFDDPKDAYSQEPLTGRPPHARNPPAAVPSLTNSTHRVVAEEDSLDQMSKWPAKFRSRASTAQTPKPGLGWGSKVKEGKRLGQQDSDGWS
ncbi:uncharacterized protein LOC135821185 isoform X2 [Sycon ciliatum]|uniref:uncharacterized protein LOC135821185 isoform X2 n=1 Tax=Sycon ciliatum TaxID=27933 RepID=UPI0031F69C3E